MIILTYAHEQIIQFYCVSVSIPYYEPKNDGKRNYSKLDHCLFCNKVIKSKVSTHYLNSHTSEEKVRQAKLLPESPERNKILLELENRGNYKHNVKVICFELPAVDLLHFFKAGVKCRVLVLEHLPMHHQGGVCICYSVWLIKPIQNLND